MRTTIQIRLRGAGHEGLGEDISPFPDHPDPVGDAPSDLLRLAGEWTLGSFCDHLGTLEQWPSPPDWAAATLYRNWAYESAALDLALRQAGRSLHEVLEREPRPLTFVNSLGLGDPPRPTPSTAGSPATRDVHFKLDAAAAWDLALCEDLAATGAVDVVDFKGQYGRRSRTPGRSPPSTGVVAARSRPPSSRIPHDLPEVAAPLAPTSPASPTTR